MAEGGIDIICDWCLQDNINVSATRYCFECSHKLCSLCVTLHGKCKPLINHKLTNIDGHDFNTESIELVRSLQQCPNHPFAIVKYVCKDHDEVCCNECAIVTHRKCDQLVQLSEECRNRTTEPYSRFTSTTLNELDEQTNNLLQCENNNQNIIVETKKHVKQELSKVKRKLDRAFNTLEQRVLSEMEQRSDFLLKKSTERCNEIERTTDKITTVKHVAGIVANTDVPVLWYLFDRLQRRQTLTRGTNVSELMEKTEDRDILLVKLKSMDDICQTIAENFKVGIVLRTPTLSLEQPEPEPDFTRRLASLECEITISDTDWDIRSCVWFGDNIILANCLKKELVQFDIETGEIVCTYGCLGKPWSITVIDDASIAVCYNTNFIDIFSLEHNQFIPQQKLTTEMCIIAASMNWYGNELVCVSTTEGSIIVVSLDDQSVHCVPMDTTSRDDLRTALNIVYDNNTDEIHVTCYLKNTVISFERLDEYWNIRRILSSGLIQIHGPWGITVDVDNNVYIVTDHGSVEQFDRNLQFIRQIVNEDEDRDNTWCLTFNEAMTKFALSGYGFVKVFNFR